MQDKKLSTVFQWLLFLSANIAFLLLFPYFLLSLPNPLPLLIVLAVIGVQALFFRLNRARLLALTLVLVAFLATLFSAMDTYAFTNKCAVDEDGEFRSVAYFEECTKTITPVDVLYYGLLTNVSKEFKARYAPNN